MPSWPSFVAPAKRRALPAGDSFDLLQESEGTKDAGVSEPDFVREDDVTRGAGAKIALPRLNATKLYFLGFALARNRLDRTFETIQRV